MKELNHNFLFMWIANCIYDELLIDDIAIIFRFKFWFILDNQSDQQSD